MGATTERGAPLDPRLPDHALADWPRRLTQRLTEYLRSRPEVDRIYLFGAKKTKGSAKNPAEVG